MIPAGGDGSMSNILLQSAVDLIPSKSVKRPSLVLFFVCFLTQGF
jgi:hypothetical protein